MTIDAQRHSDEMAAQRAQELAGDDRLYRLRKACAVRAVEMYKMLEEARMALRHSEFPTGFDRSKLPNIDQLLTEIDDAAE